MAKHPKSSRPKLPPEGGYSHSHYCLSSGRPMNEAEIEDARRRPAQLKQGKGGMTLEERKEFNEWRKGQSRVGEDGRR